MTQSGVTCLGPEQTPSHGWTVLGLNELGRMYMDLSTTPPPLRPVVPGPLRWGPRSRLALLQLSQAQYLQRMVEPVGGQTFANSLGLHVSWWWGSHAQPPSLGPPQHPPHSASAGLGICLRGAGNSKGVMRYKLSRMFVQALSTGI